ncbi:Tyr recombinase domain-containing protein [Vibrio chagasii]|nr:Tyr recombinase domain-containing protein [Vibrio chagasii]CAH7346543.1 Tyr recombinase domain-containing protein [Vibrio chagasii]
MFEDLLPEDLIIEESPPSASFELIVKDEPNKFELSTSSNVTENRNPALSYVASLESKRSQETMGYALNSVASTFGFTNLRDFPWQDLNYDAVQFLIRHLKAKDLAPSTINLYLTAVKQTIEHALDLEIIDQNVARRILRIKPQAGKRLPKGREVESTEIRSFIQSCLDFGQTKNLRDAAIICVMRGCGLRREEVVTLKKSNLCLETRRIRIIGKRNKERELAIPSELFPIVLKWYKFKEDYEWKDEEPEWFFVPVNKHNGLAERKLSGSSIAYILKSRIETNEDKVFKPHDLRRTFCTDLLRHHELNDVRELMGHSSESTTVRYDMRSKERLFDISDAIKVL